MKYLSVISALFFFTTNTTAFASTTELDVIYSPFSEGLATLSVPTRVGCETTGSSAPTTVCLTPGASLDLGGLRDVTIEKVVIIAGQAGDLVYSDETYQGYMLVNGTKVSVQLTTKLRNGNKIAGTLFFTKDQAFTAIPR